MRGLEGVSGLERQADAVTQSLATGGSAQIHDLMTATAKASLGVDLLVQVRNRAVEAYQEIMRLQV
jgi:flagellar hook-basal body complex protein FliE